MPIELSILTFIILIVLPFVFLIISIRPTQEGYEYVKISMMVLTSILFFIAAYAFVSTGGISIIDTTPPDTYYNPTYNEAVCSFGNSLGCPIETFTHDMRGISGGNNRIVFFAIDGQYNKTLIGHFNTTEFYKEVFRDYPDYIPHLDIFTSSIFATKESNPIVGSSFDMIVLASIYMMIGLISTVFAVGEIFRIPAKRL